MKISKTWFVLGVSLLLSCQGSAKTEEGVQAGSLAKPIAVPASQASRVAKAPPAIEKKKLSQMDDFDFMDLLKAQGWQNPSSGGMEMGQWKQSTLRAKKGDKSVKLTVVRPSGKPADPKSSTTVQTPKDQYEALGNKDAARLLRDDYLIWVAIDGDDAGARALLDALVAAIVIDSAS